MIRKTAPIRPVPAPTPLDGALRMAISAHQQGQHGGRCRVILATAPKHPDALHYLGVLLHQLGQHNGARVLIERALKWRAKPAATSAATQPSVCASRTLLNGDGRMMSGWRRK